MRTARPCLHAGLGASLLLMLPLASVSRAQTKSAAVDVRLDPATTAIHWTLGATAHTVHGSFRLKSGVIHVDPASGEASGLIVIDAASGESGDKSRDGRMHREVIESEKYPEITFRATRVSRPGGRMDLTAPGPLTVDGVLTLHGQEHPLQLTMDLRTGQGGNLTTVTSFDIPYVAWGMKDPSTFILRVEKHVHVTVEAAATLPR